MSQDILIPLCNLAGRATALECNFQPENVSMCNVVSDGTAAAAAAFSPARLVGKLETVEGMLCLKSRS